MVSVGGVIGLGGEAVEGCGGVELVEGLVAVEDLPMLFIRGARMLVFADLHLGFEEDMAEKGIFLPRVQLRKALEAIERGLEVTQPDAVVIAGDVKHIFSRLGRYEMRELRELFEFLTRRVGKVYLVRGNHDNFVAPIARRFGVEIVNELWLGDVLVVHGHRPLPEGAKPRVVVMGHEHPSVALRDSLGSVAKIPCFLTMPLKRGSRLVVLPALGIYQSGTSVSLQRDSYLSPVIKEEGVLEEAVPFAVLEDEGVYELPPLKLIEDLLEAPSF